MGIRPAHLALATVAACALLGAEAAWAQPTNDQTRHPHQAQVGEQPAQLDAQQPIWCLFDGKGDALYAQCDKQAKECLFHRGCRGAGYGPSCTPLERIEECVEPPEEHRFEELVARGMRFVPAIADAPAGWTRDTAGRVFQTEFDMNRRIWLGARYTPSFALTSSGERREQLGRALLETGLRADVLGYDTRTRYRFSALEAEVGLSPLSVEAMAFRFDTSSESGLPLARLTTFWPEPVRHDLYLNVGWWVELMGVSYRPRDSVDETHLRFAGAGGTWDLWHDRELIRYLRLRLGGAFDDLYLGRENIGHRLAATPVGALEGDLPFDRAGMHRLTFGSRYETPLVFDGRNAMPRVSHRFSNGIAYEVIVLAINDQPVSLRLSTHGGYRDDVVEQAAGWEVGGGIGLRVSFWAPAPDEEDRERIQELRHP